jgi:hypothetical protein
LLIQRNYIVNILKKFFIILTLSNSGIYRLDWLWEKRTANIYVRKIYVILILLILFFSFSKSSAQMSVILNQPPPNQLNIPDLWKLTLNNLSTTSYSVFLEATVDEATDGKILEARSKQFDLSPGLKIITVNNVPSASITYKNNRYKEVILRTGNAPAGNYTICVYVRSTNGNELGHDCINQIVNPVSPPMNISPGDGDSISENHPQFTWLPPSPVSGNQRITYTLRIVEIIGSQLPPEAMKNNPAWFEKNDIITSPLVYPTSAQNLISGKSYAWQVVAFIDGNNSGSSEVWKFTMKVITQPTLMTRQEAIDLIIKQIIVPQTLNHYVSAYLPMELTPPGTKIKAFFDDDGIRTIENYSWFGWINDDPQAFFQHNTRFVFIDASSRKYEVVNHNWWPVVDDVSLWMSDEEKSNPEVLIYSDVNLK